METEQFDHSITHIEAEKRLPRRLLIFGQGPIIDQELRIKAQDANTPLGNEDMNLWGYGLSEAAAILYKRGVVGELIVMGGKTGGKSPEGEYASESEIMTRRLVELGVPPEVIKQEELRRSTNTLENLIYLLEEYIDEDPSNKAELDTLGTAYHSARIRILMDLFAIPYKHAFIADEVIRAEELEKRDPTSAKLSEIEKRLHINEASRIPVSEADMEVKVGFYDDKVGTEKKDILRRFQEEDAFTRALLETPEYWICYVGKIKSDERFQQVIKNVNELFPSLLAEYEISLSANSPQREIDEVKAKLSKIPRKLPNLDEMIKEQQTTGWPLDTIKKLDEVVDKRTQNK